MQSVFYNILPIFLIAFLGSVLRRKWLKSNEFWRGLEKLSFYILFPTVLFEHSSKADFASSEFFRLTFALILANFLAIVALVFFQFKTSYDKIQFTTILQGGTRYNNYVFFAVGAALLGDNGLAVIATISPYLLIWTNITAVTCFAYYVPRQDEAVKYNSSTLVLRSIITNPFIIASLIGLIFNYFNLELNEGINKTIENLSDSALTIGMLIVGSSIKFKIAPEYLRQVVCTSMIKLMAIPVLSFAMLWILGVDGVERSVGVLFSCLPTASSSYVLSRQLGGDPETMASTITFTIIFSILSLSLLVYIFA